MNTHLLNIDGVQWLRGWVLYDGGSPAFCRLAAQLENALTRRGFDLAPLQTPWVCECLDLPEGDCTEKIYVLTVQGKCFAGIPALLYIARHKSFPCSRLPANQGTRKPRGFGVEQGRSRGE